MKHFLVTLWSNRLGKIRSTLPLAGRRLAWKLPRRSAGRAVDQFFQSPSRPAPGWLILVALTIPLALSAQPKDPVAGKSPAKPTESSPPVAVAKPVPEPEVHAPAPDSQGPEVTPPAPDQAPQPPPTEEQPQPTPDPKTTEPAPEKGSAEPPNMRVTLVDGTRRVAVPLTKNEATPSGGKKELPVVVSPYPPKALAELPVGWKLMVDPTVSPVPYQVKLADGRTLEVEVIPPCLVPDGPGNAMLFQIERGASSPESTLSAARKAHSESRAKVQDLLRKLEATIPPPPSPATPSP